MTSTFFQRILILVLLAGCMTGLHAQEYKYEIGGMAGGAFYMGDVNKNAFFKGLNPAFGAVFRYNPNFRWAVKTNLMWGQVSGTTEGQQNVFPDHAHLKVRHPDLLSGIRCLLYLHRYVQRTHCNQWC